ncbi:LPS assembly protein LptD [Candidatus Pelagibacter sp. FZCC0015]|uniref:LPS assembly protein LptD n=1 Tax=Candidatus Pelagibacter sp. FZCC0015 TaxID=2268451 RepID=UPI00119CABDC|nr:LPS assembly protein LptD [Candidatus Pelagibacter sp. FZCC0015]
MKNNINFFLSLLLIYFVFFFDSHANEQFNFDVTEIEILDEGNKIIGSKKGRVTTNDGIIINANKFIYNKSTNVLEAEGSVNFLDEKNEYQILADKIIYFKNNEIVNTYGNSKAIYKKNFTIDAKKFEFNKNSKILNAQENVIIIDPTKNHKILGENITYYKNEEKIVSIGNTKAFIQSKYEIISSDVSYFINKEYLISNKKTIVKDRNFQNYHLSKFHYQINDEILKGEKILIITNEGLPNSDKFYFKNAMINLNSREFIAKDIDIRVHKNVFSNPENDPRLLGSSSRGDSELTVVNKGIFTSCKINDTCPPWSISAKKIVHNKIKKELIYENAYLNIFDIPILYFPKFFHPDPTVTRQTGFLTPEINNSNVLGSSITLPYFKKISENKDNTFTPSVFDKNIFMIENEFRQTKKNYDLLADVGFVKNYDSPTTKKKKNLSHLFLKLNHDLNLENYDTSDFILSIENVSNDTYLKVFDQQITKSKARPNDLNKLNSHMKFILNNDKFNFNTGIDVYEDLQVNKSDRYQFILPYYNFNTEILKNRYEGTFNLNSSGSNILQDTNNLKSEIINDLNFNSLNYYSDLGLSTSYNINIKNLNTMGKKIKNYKSSPQSKFISLFNIDTSLPLIKNTEKYNNYLTPKISLKVNPSDMKNYSDSSNTINVGNIFANNRLGLSDTFESGRSLTLGLDYKKENKNDLDNINRYFELKLATVLRDKEENFIPAKSTINRKSSNLFGSITSNISDNLNINYNFALDNNYKNFEYNNLNATFSINNLITSFNFIEENGEMGDSNVFENEISYKFDEQNYISFNTRRNRKLNLTEYYDLVYEYKNDCLIAGIKYKKSYYEDRDLKPTENLLFTITLFPLTTYEHDAQDLL